MPAVTFALGTHVQLGQADARTIALVLEARTKISPTSLARKILEVAEGARLGPVAIDQPADLDALLAAVDDRRTPNTPRIATFRAELVAERARRHLGHQPAPRARPGNPKI